MKDVRKAPLSVLQFHEKQQHASPWKQGPIHRKPLQETTTHTKPPPVHPSIG